MRAQCNPGIGKPWGAQRRSAYCARDRAGGAWLNHEMMGLGIRAVVVMRHLITYAETHDAFVAGRYRIQNDSHCCVGSLRIDLDGPDGTDAMLDSHLVQYTCQLV